MSDAIVYPEVVYSTGDGKPMAETQRAEIVAAEIELLKNQLGRGS